MKTISILLTLLFVSGGISAYSATYASSCSDVTGHVAVKAEAEPFDTLSFEKMVAEEIFTVIPDHAINDVERLRSHSTPELAELLVEAFDIPEKSPGDIGDEEFLFYFVTSNDEDSTANIPPKATLKTVTDSVAVVDVFWCGRDHTLSLVRKGSKWLLDDFDDIKKDLSRYVDGGRKFYSSGEYTSVSFYYEEWIERVKNYMKNYLHKEFIPMQSADTH